MCLLLGETIKQTQRTLVKRQQILHFCSLLYWVVVACNILLHHFRFVTMGMAYPVVTNAPDINMPIFVTINNIISVINKMIQVCHKIGRTCVPNVVSQTSSGSRLLPKCFNVCPKTQLVPGLSQNPNGPLLVPKTKRFNVCPKTIKICSKLVKNCHLSQMYKKKPRILSKECLKSQIISTHVTNSTWKQIFFLKKGVHVMPVTLYVHLHDKKLESCVYFVWWKSDYSVYFLPTFIFHFRHNSPSSRNSFAFEQFELANIDEINTL